MSASESEEEEGPGQLGGGADTPPSEASSPSAGPGSRTPSSGSVSILTAYFQKVTIIPLSMQSSTDNCYFTLTLVTCVFQTTESAGESRVEGGSLEGSTSGVSNSQSFEHLTLLLI